ncbi:MAG: LuxR C-terminal-related transcriptional regulator, partial [Chloroflexota bacterium]
EQEILRLIVEGNSNKEIAQTLYVELPTVKWHITKIYKKLGVRSRVQAIVRARELNLIVFTDEYEAESPGATATSIVLAEPVNPYKGLMAFEPADNRHFFGREALVKTLLSNLAAPAGGAPSRRNEKGQGRFLAVVGPSGSGKSSLVKAGLIPALWSGKLPGSDRWFIVDMTPGPRPLDELEIALTRIAADQAINLRQHLDRDGHGLSRAAALILPNDDSELLLVVDQFEELFTLVEDEAVRGHLIALLHGAVTDPRSRVRVIITLRADFYDRPLQYPAFGQLLRDHMETLLPLSAEELERAIVNPAEMTGVAFEPGLVASIIEDVNYRPGALPLLQYALTELFERREGRLLTNEAYATIGGAAGALAGRAEELYQEQDGAGREAIHQMFLRLVTVGEVEGSVAVGATSDGPLPPDIRQRVLRAELLSAAADPDGLDEIIDTFAAYRLLSLNHHPATRQPTVEVAHEAILREWGRLRGWLEESQADLALHRQLIRATAEWLEAEHDWSFLLRGSRLSQFEAWAVGSQIALTGQEQAFLDASLANRMEREIIERQRQEHEAQLERRASSRLKALVVVLSLALVIAVGLTIAAVSFARQAEQQRHVAVARELASAALVQLSSDPELAVLLALQAAESTYSEFGTVLPEAEDALHQAVQADRIQQTFETSSGAVDISPDGRLLAITDSEDFMLVLRDVATGEVVREFADEHIDAITDITFSPDGRFIASADRGTVVKLWDVVHNQSMATFPGHDGPVSDIAFSPDGAWLATASDDGLVRLWALDDVLQKGARSLHPREHVLALQTPSRPTNLVFDPNGRRIAVYVPDSGIFVWDITSGEELLEIPTSNEYATGLDYSVNGQFLAGSSTQLQAAVWDARTGEKLLSLPVSSPITDVKFSQDNRRLVTAGEDGAAILWNIETGQELLELSGHSQRIQRVIFSPDRQWLATGSDDGTTKIWDIGVAGNREMFTLVAHDELVYDAVYSPDGSRIASTGDDGQVKLWDAQNGELLFAWSGLASMNFPVFSPDGRRLAAANATGGVSIWDVASGQELLDLRGVEQPWIAIAFGPDGERLAATGSTGIGHIWDTSSGKQLATFRNDGAPIMELLVASDRFVSMGVDGWFIHWDLNTGQRICDGKDARGITWDAELSSGKRVLIAYASYAGVARVLRTGETLCDSGGLYTLRGHAGNVTGVAFTPGGDQLATSGIDATVRLWDMADGEQTLILTGHTLPVNGVDFSPNGRYLASAGSDGTIRVYVMEVEELMDQARSRLSRDFTRDECQRFLHLSACPDEQR